MVGPKWPLVIWSSCCVEQNNSGKFLVLLVMIQIEVLIARARQLTADAWWAMMHFCYCSNCLGCCCCCHLIELLCFPCLIRSRNLFHLVTKVPLLVDVGCVACREQAHEPVLRQERCGAKIQMHSPMGRSYVDGDKNETV